MLREFDGALGVRFFFTISGFLITWLLLREEKEFGSISLKYFYGRRALRILPVYVAAMLVLVIIQTLGISTQKPYIWIQLVTFTRNFHQTAFPECLISGHFWSLSVEEQFYFVWPIVFSLLAFSARKRIGFLVYAVLLSTGWKIMALLGCYNRHLYFLFEEGSTFLFIDCIAYGCIGAILLTTKTESLKAFFARYSSPLFLVSCLLLVMVEIIGLGEGLQNLVFSVMLLESIVLPEYLPFRLLNHPWMVKIGILSYSIYIWQQFVFLLWPWPTVWFLTVPAIFIIAWLSYQFLEKPFFALRARFRKR